MKVLGDKMEEKTQNSVFILERKYKIEDYYPVESIVGVFSSKEKAEEAISILETKHKAKILDGYFDYKFNTQDREIKSNNEMIRLHGEALKRRVPGSNGYAKTLSTLNYAKEALKKAENFVPESYENWVERQSKFNRDVFEIVEMTVDNLYKYKKDIL